MAVMVVIVMMVVMMIHCTETRRCDFDIGASECQIESGAHHGRLGPE